VPVAAMVAAQTQLEMIAQAGSAIVELAVFGE
jgi:hypothetical protein